MAIARWGSARNMRSQVAGNEQGRRAHQRRRRGVVSRGSQAAADRASTVRRDVVASAEARQRQHQQLIGCHGTATRAVRALRWCLIPQLTGVIPDAQENGARRGKWGCLEGSIGRTF